MKKNSKAIYSFALFGVLTVCLLLSQCGPSSGKSAIQNSFDEVAAKLDSGGEVYMYLSTESFSRTVDKFLDKVKEIASAQGEESPEEAEKSLKAVGLIQHLIGRIGLSEVSGVGMSSIALSEEINHTKFVVHHYPDQGEGLLWKMLSDSPKEQPELKLLPEDTVLAGASEFRLKELWEWLKSEAESLDIPDVKKAIGSIEPMLKSQGLELEKVLAALPDRIGMALILDREKTFTVPAEGLMLEIPEPGLALILSVPDDSLFNLVATMLGMVEKVEDESVKKLKIPVPPLPFPLAPVIVQQDNLLFIASSEQLVDTMLANQKSGKGLIASEEFKGLNRNMPAKGNRFRYISARLLQTFLDIQKKAMAASDKIGNEEVWAMELMSMLPLNLKMLEITQNTKEGFISTFNHNLDVEYMMLLPATVLSGVVPMVIMSQMSKESKKNAVKFMD